MANATDLIGYAYDSALHCVECAAHHFATETDKAARECLDTDEHGLPYDLIDCDGNPVTPIFESTELESYDCCDDCQARFLA